jgi:hypothetical protein
MRALSRGREVLITARAGTHGAATVSGTLPQIEQDILTSLREIAKHSSTLVIADHLSTVLHTDEIVAPEHGRIDEPDSHTTLLRQNGRYAALWRAQQHSYMSIGREPLMSIERTLTREDKNHLRLVDLPSVRRTRASY